MAGFELSRSGVGVVSGTTEIQVCDAGFYSELQGTVLIMEAYDAFQGRAYTATMSAIDLNVARDWASALLQSACN